MAKWYAKAAAQGHTFAQVKFGEALGTARGIPQDLEKAYFWLTIASQRDAGDLKTRALSVRDQITRVLPPAKIVAIEASAKAWRPGATN
ncbi:MAG: sel1 repeat family protein [Rhodospirillales bacterium]|nr:sel1 repeat family protein [Rhodospirillales bacterium]